MTEWIWKHIIGPAISGTFAFVPLWVWIILGALALGWAWKTFGWQGLISAGIALLAIGAYREGWKARDSLDSENVDPNSPDALPAPKKRKRVTTKADDENRIGTRWNAQKGGWE